MSIQKSEGDAAAKKEVLPFKKTVKPPMMFKKIGANNKIVDKFDDKIQKYTLVFCTGKESSEKWDNYCRTNTKLIHEFT